jgi:ABC-type amino acid transport substrate-binding protein
MSPFPQIALLSLAFFATGAGAACAPLRIAYPDQHYPPYWLGNGDHVAEPPGAGAELLRKFGASAGCAVALKRLPAARIQPALMEGQVDFAPQGVTSANQAAIAFPRDKAGQPDPERSLPQLVVVFVRAADGPGRDADPAPYFRDHVLATVLGSSYLARMRNDGLRVDSGATNVTSNLDKLRLHRVDGVAVSMISAGDMDGFVAARYGAALVRLAQPLYSDHVWLAANAGYYATHQAQVEGMWTWLAGPGKLQFARLLKKYADQH